MIALVLGLLLVGGVINVFLSNREVYHQNENLARLQENARYAFEIMGRSIREAGGIACGNVDLVNVLNNADTTWWSTWGDGIHGYEGDEVLPAKATGTNATERVAGTDAVIVWSGTTNDGVYISEHNPSAAQFKVNTLQHGIVDGDILIVCDYKHAAIFQTTNASENNVTIVHNTGNSVTPGNCTKGLGSPRLCTANGTAYTFEDNGFISKLSAQAWYIGFNGRGGRSLYRVKLQNNGGTAATVAEEMVEGVTDLQITYLTRDSAGNLATNYVDATTIPDYDGDGNPDWNNVVAARLTFTLQSLEQVGVDSQNLERKWYTVVTLRNRQS